MVFQIVLGIFLFFALTRAIGRWRDGSISFTEFILWSFVWVGIGLIVFLPKTSSFLAKMLGVGRGADAVIYLAVIILFYAIFRIVVKLEFIEHEITHIVRNIAIEKGEANDASSIETQKPSEHDTRQQ